jgi:hypothetical protein
MEMSFQESVVLGQSTHENGNLFGVWDIGSEKHLVMRDVCHVAHDFY